MILNKVRRVCLEEMGFLAIPPRLRFAQSLAACLPYLAAGRIRTALYRWGGVRIGPGSVVMGSLRLWGRCPLVIGSHSTLNAPLAINLDAPVLIGNGVYIGNDVLILTADHKIGPHYARGAGGGHPQPVTIEDGVWIAANVTILPGVTLGAGSVVAAGAVVTKDIPIDALVAGVPARVLRSLASEITETN